MYKFKNEGMKVPCYVWSKKGSIEESCIEQIAGVSSLPFAFHHTVLNADGHLGYGLPIGGVLATKGVVIPNAVGVDIGCSVTAIKTTLSLNNTTQHDISKIIDEVEKEIPFGTGLYPEIDTELKDYLEDLESKCVNA